MTKGLFLFGTALFYFSSMTKKQEQLVYLLMGINVLIFFASFICVSLNQRLAADDFHYLAKTQELGIWDSMLYYYNHWNTRWASSLVRAGFLQLFTEKYVTSAVNVNTLIGGLISIKIFLSKLVSATQLPISKNKQWIVSGYLLAVIFYASFEKADTWFWLSSTPSYLWGCFSILLGGAFLLEARKSIVKNIFVFFVFLFVGGSSESVAIAAIISLCYLGFITKNSQQTISIDRTALHLATLACMISFGATLIGPGIEIRREHLPSYPLSDKLLVGFWNYFKFNFKEIPLLLPLVMLLVTPFGFLGRKQLRFQLISIRDIFWSNRKLWGLADLTIAIVALSLAMVMGEMGPTRTWLPITFIVVAVAVFIAYQLGTWVYIKSKGKLFQLVIAAQLVIVLLQGVTAFNQYGITINYARAVDSRMQEIASIENQSDGIYQLNRLPNSGWLFTSEITSDTTHFTNKHLKLFFQNKHNLVVKDALSSSIE